MSPVTLELTVKVLTAKDAVAAVVVVAVVACGVIEMTMVCQSVRVQRSRMREMSNPPLVLLGLMMISPRMMNPF